VRRVVGNAERDVVHAAPPDGAAQQVRADLHMHLGAGTTRAGRENKDFACFLAAVGVGAGTLETEHLGQETLRRLQAMNHDGGMVQPTDGDRGRHGAVVPGRSARHSVLSLLGDKREALLFRVYERQARPTIALLNAAVLDASFVEARLPPLQSGSVGHAQSCFGDGSRAVPARGGIRPVKERHLSARTADLVAVKQVVGRHIVLVDRLFTRRRPSTSV
jgi:hypothetical protein